MRACGRARAYSFGMTQLASAYVCEVRWERCKTRRQRLMKQNNIRAYVCVGGGGAEGNIQLLYSTNEAAGMMSSACCLSATRQKSFMN